MDEITEITKITSKITCNKGDLNQISRNEALDKLLELGKRDNGGKCHKCEGCEM